MEILIYLSLLSLIILFTILLLLFLLFLGDSVFRGHDLPTTKKAIKNIGKIISEHKTDANNFYDLGCARGKLAIAIKKDFPGLSVYGLDNSALRLFFAKLKNLFFRQKIDFLKTDIFQANLNNADIIYTYLWYDLMPILENKLQKELKKGALVITNTSYFPNWQPVQTYITDPKNPDFEKLFVYIKN